MEGYTVKIEESSEELKGKQRIIMKDTSDALKLDEATEGGNSIIIKVEKWAILKVHNEKADDKEYENYIIIDSEGHKFVTGSQSFWSSFINIYEEMKDEDEEWAIKVYRLPSKNYKGKEFITCSVI